jgi:hypothetical protein
MVAALVFSRKYKVLPVYALILFLFTLDYTNYYFNIGSSVSGYLVKLYIEVLFIFSSLRYIARAAKSKKAKKIALLILSFAIAFLIVGIAKNGALNAILDWRSSILPIALAFLLVHSNILDHRTTRKAIEFFCLLTILNSMLAIYQYSSFDGNAESSWRYNFLIDARQNNESNTEERFVNYQIVRDDKLRASGIFVSALQYSYIAAMAAFYLFLKLFLEQKKKLLMRAIYTAAFMVLSAGIVVSQVRASLMILAICIAAFFFFIKRTKRSIVFDTKKSAFLIVSSYALILFVLFFYGGDALDSSAAGRAPQYLKAISEFTIVGAGLGKYRGQFDSYFVYGAMTFGIAFFMIPFVYSRLFSSAFRPAPRLPENEIIIIFAFGISISAAIISLFQHLSGSIYYYMTWILLVISANLVRRKSDQAIEVNYLNNRLPRP